MVIEDDSCAAEIFHQMLTGAGYDVVVVGSAEAGLMETSRLSPAAVVLDLHLPAGTGLEYLRQLRAMPDRGEVPVAIVTGDYLLDENTARELTALGARIHFKPVWEEDLLRIVAALVPP